MADVTDYYEVAFTTRPRRELISNPDFKLYKLNDRLKRFGYKLISHGYEKLSMRYIYKFVPLKSFYSTLDYDKVIVYHASDLTYDEWESELKKRLYKQDYKAYAATMRRALRWDTRKRVDKKPIRPKKARSRGFKCTADQLVQVEEQLNQILLEVKPAPKATAQD